MRKLSYGFPIDICPSRLLTVSHQVISSIYFKSHPISRGTWALAVISDQGLRFLLQTLLV